MMSTISFLGLFLVSIFAALAALILDTDRLSAVLDDSFTEGLTVAVLLP